MRWHEYCSVCPQSEGSANQRYQQFKKFRESGQEKVRRATPDTSWKDRKVGKEEALGPTALIVDDNASLAYFTAYSLRQEVEGLKVITAGSCREALVLADQYCPSVLIVDLKLPDGNGFELVDDLKRRFPRTIPILITATQVPEDLNRDLFGVLIKPYEPEALIDLVRLALKSDHSWSGPEAESYHREESDQPSGQYEFHHVQNRLSGLLAGIRALRLELLAVAENPSEVRRTIDDYADRLSAMVKEVAQALKKRA